MLTRLLYRCSWTWESNATPCIRCEIIGLYVYTQHQNLTHKVHERMPTLKSQLSEFESPQAWRTWERRRQIFGRFATFRRFVSGMLMTYRSTQELRKLAIVRAISTESRALNRRHYRQPKLIYNILFFFFFLFWFKILENWVLLFFRSFFTRNIPIIRSRFLRNRRSNEALYLPFSAQNPAYCSGLPIRTLFG